MWWKTMPRMHEMGCHAKGSMGVPVMNARIERVTCRYDDDAPEFMRQRRLRLEKSYVCLLKMYRALRIGHP
jgi:hypothetical protein